MKILYWLIISTVILFTGCASKLSLTQDSEEIIDLSDTQYVTDVSDANLFTIQSIIQPEEKCIINNIDKVLLSDSLLYMLDRKSMNVSVMDLNGKIISSISSHGHSKKEYIDLTDIFIDNDNKTLNLVSRTDRKLLAYDSSGMKLQTVKELPKEFYSMFKAGNNYIGYAANYVEDKKNPYNFWLLNNNMKIIKKYSKIDDYIESRFSQNFPVFSENASNISFICQYNYKVYQYKNGEFTCPYYLDFGKLAIDDNILKNIDDRNIQIKLQNRICEIDRFQETDNYLLVFVNYQGQEVLYVYDKSLRTYKTYYLDCGEAKLFPLQFGRIVGCDNHHIYTIIDRQDVERLCKGKDEYNNYEKEYPTQINLLRKMVKYPFNNSNPFIVIYNIK